MGDITMYFSKLPTSGKVKFALTFPFCALVVIICGIVIIVSDCLSTGFESLSGMVDEFGHSFGDRVGAWYDPPKEDE